MADAVFSFGSFELNGTQTSYGVFDDYDKGAGKQDNLFGIEEWEEFDSLCSRYGLFQEKIGDKGGPYSQIEHQQEPIRSNYWRIDDELQSETISAPIQPVHGSRKAEDELVREKPYPFSLASLELLNNYGGGVKKLKGENLSNLSCETNADHRRLSTEEVIRVAGARYIEISSKRGDHFCMHMHPFGFALVGLSQDETKDVELSHLLLYAAEKVDCQQYERASRLLTRCEWIASDTGNPVERIVFYFARALREKIDRETGHFTPKGLKENQRNHPIGQGLATNLASIACHQELPFSQVTQFTGVQAILEHIASSGKVHLIDLAIRSGVQWTVLMQALAGRDECPVELLKITAVTTMDKNEVQETGKRLVSFAESVKVPFSFNVVFISEMAELKEELFAIEDGEAVAVYAPLVLRSMISRPDYLDTLMRVIKKLSPSLMVVTEVEANHNSPSFVARFIEALFFYSAFFDCLEACMSTNSPYRMTTEATFFGEGIRNMVAAEGDERVIRNVKMDVWRAFFARFGMVEIEFSEWSLYQASLIIKQFPCGNCCSLDKDGECLIVGWKGTPIHSLSAWKFS